MVLAYSQNVYRMIFAWYFECTRTHTMTVFHDYNNSSGMPMKANSKINTCNSHSMSFCYMLVFPSSSFQTFQRAFHSIQCKFPAGFESKGNFL